MGAAEALVGAWQAWQADRAGLKAAALEAARAFAPGPFGESLGAIYAEALDPAGKQEQGR